MRLAVGAGWEIVHLTDRVVELRKESAVYRRFTDRDGYVLYRVEPGIDRATAIERAVEMAKATDIQMMQRVSAQLMPTGKALRDFRRRQTELKTHFGIPGEEPSERVYRA